MYNCQGDHHGGVKRHAYKISMSTSSAFGAGHILAVMSIVLSANMIEMAAERDEEGGLIRKVLPMTDRLLAGLAFSGINFSFFYLRNQHEMNEHKVNSENVSQSMRWCFTGLVCCLQVLVSVLVPNEDPLLLQIMTQTLFALNIYFEYLCQHVWVKGKDESNEHVSAGHSHSNHHIKSAHGEKRNNETLPLLPLIAGGASS